MPSAKCTLLKSAVARLSAKLPARTRAALASIRTIGCGLAIAAGVLAGSPVYAQESHAPDAALQQLLREARSVMPGACTQPGIVRMVRILCSGRISIAVSWHDRLDDQSCTLAAQDDSFFASYFTDPRFTGRYSAKFGFAQVPWGMAVNRNGSERLGRALDLISQIFHRDGVFLASARGNRIGAAFLEQQATVWARPECNSDTGATNPACILPALDATLKPTVFADSVTAFETWFASRTGIDVTLPILKRG